jgi:hypothetical protein
MSNGEYLLDALASDLEKMSYLEMLDIVASGPTARKLSLIYSMAIELPEDVILALADDDDPVVRHILVEWRPVPIEKLIKMTHDCNPTAAAAANWALRVKRSKARERFRGQY